MFMSCVVNVHLYHGNNILALLCFKCYKTFSTYMSFEMPILFYYLLIYLCFYASTLTNVVKHVSMFIKVKVISMLFVYSFPFRNQEPIRGRVEENTLVLSLGFYVQNNPNDTDLRCLLDIKILTQQTT